MKSIVHTGASRVYLLALVFALASLASQPAVAGQAEVLQELALQTQRISDAVMAADRGQPDAYAALRDSRARFASGLQTLQHGGRFDGCMIAPPSAALQKSLGDVASRWRQFDHWTNLIVNFEDDLRQIRAGVKDVNDAEKTLISLTGELHKSKLAKGTVREASATEHLLQAAPRIVKNANRMISDEAIDPDVAFQLFKDRNNVVDILDGFAAGSAGLRLAASKGADRRKALEIAKAFEPVKNATQLMYSNLQRMISNKMATRLIADNGQEFLRALQKLQGQVPNNEPCVQAIR